MRKSCMHGIITLLPVENKMKQSGGNERNERRTGKKLGYGKTKITSIHSVAMKLIWKSLPHWKMMFEKLFEEVFDVLPLTLFSFYR